MEIKIHSIVDVITNSSSEIYTMNKDKLKENIEGIIESLTFLAEADVDIKDIFEISVSSEDMSINIYGLDDQYNDYLLDKDFYSEEEGVKIEKRFKYHKENPEKIKKIVDSMKALFDLKCIDYR